nr:hypothetical protein [Tanacetum cinerariifolium]
HDNVEDLIESALNSKLLLINSNSQRLEKEQQEVKNVVEQPAERGNLHAVATTLSTEEPEYSSSMGYEHLSITPKTESDEVTESNVENLLPIPSECEDIEYVETSLLDPEIFSKEEENVVQHDVEEEEVDLEDISQIQDVVLREKLLSITRLIFNIESLNDNPTPDRMLNSFESNNSLSDNFSLKFKTFCDYTEETRSEEADLFISFDNLIPTGIENVADDSKGDVHFLEELLIDDSILSHESSDSNFKDNPSIPRPPLDPPDAETNSRKEILVVMNNT